MTIALQLLLVRITCPTETKDSIISRGDGEEDPDAPGCLEETRFWCVVKRVKTESESQVPLARK